MLRCVIFIEIDLKRGQSHSEMKRLIELHFERCLIALAARRDSLLRDLENKINDNRTSLFSKNVF
jgi:hypothetical protein